MAYSELGKMILRYSQLWMKFVLEKCDEGTGVKPRYGSQEGRGPYLKCILFELPI